MCVWGGVVWGFREGRCDVSSGLSQPGEKAVEQSGGADYYILYISL